MICYNIYYDIRYHRNQHQQRRTAVLWIASFRPSVFEEMTFRLTDERKENPKDAGGLRGSEPSPAGQHSGHGGMKPHEGGA